MIEAGRYRQAVATVEAEEAWSLPTHLENVDLRLLIAAIGVLAQVHPVNPLAAEAVAAAAHLQTGFEVAIDHPEVRAAASAEGVGYRVA